jgi:putative oxidoreductase
MKSDRQFRQRLLLGGMDALRIGLGIMFLWSSLFKIRQPYDFLHAVYAYEIVGRQMGVLVAAVLPWVELFVGIALISGVCATGAMLLCAGMGAMFTFVISWAVYYDLGISCGCFSASGQGQVGYFALLRAIAITVAGLILYVLMVRRSADHPNVSVG